MEEDSKTPSHIGETPLALPHSRRDVSAFLHGLEQEEAALKIAKVKPWFSFGCLLAAASTSMVALVALLVVHDRTVWPTSGIYRVMQPASWLSALNSFNGFVLSLAFAEGITITWWRYTSKKETTLADLHRLWETGDSIFAALRHVRRGMYLTYVVIALALLPLNGFLLQGALAVKNVVHIYKNVTIPVPMSTSLPLGYSAYRDTAASVDPAGSRWPYVWQQVQNMVGSPMWQYAYFGNWNCSRHPNGDNCHPWIYDDSSIYHTRANGAGFDASCVTHEEHYDFAPTPERIHNHGRIFESSFTWNESHPNEMVLKVMRKTTSSCVGNLVVKTCHLKAATFQYPIQVQMNVSATSYPGPFYILQPGTTRANDTFIRYLPQYEAEGSRNWTYAGIAQSFGAYYNASFDVFDVYPMSARNGTYRQTGSFLQAFPDAYYNPQQINLWFCNATFISGLRELWYLGSITHPGINQNTLNGMPGNQDAPQADVVDLMLERLRIAMFLSSVYLGSPWYTIANDWYHNTPVLEPRSYYVQDVLATQLKPETVYDVRWELWAAATAINWFVIAMVLPTFWQFWRFDAAPSMSPIMVARLFHAPAVADGGPVPGGTIDTRTLLKVVGKKKVHDLLGESRDRPSSSP